MNILKLTVILSVFAIFNWSCVQKVTKGNTMYYSDFDPFSLTGLQIDTMQLDSNNIMAKVEFISDIKKNVTTYCNNNRVKSEYNFDGRYWYENFEVNVEGCKEYCFVYILGSKKIVLSYCNNPFITDIYYLKTLILHTKESLYRYGFDKAGD